MDERPYEPSYEQSYERDIEPSANEPWEESPPDGPPIFYSWREIGRMFARGTMIVILIFTGVFLVTAILGWFGPTP